MLWILLFSECLAISDKWQLKMWGSFEMAQIWHLSCVLSVWRSWILLNLLMFLNYEVNPLLMVHENTLSIVPRPHFNPPRGKGGLVNIVQHFCTSMNFSSTIWLAGLVVISPVLGFLIINHLAVLIALSRPTYVAHLHLDFQDLFLATSCEAVLYSPDPPFLFGGGSGFKTSMG